MPKTVDQVKLRALQILGVASSGQSITAEDSETIDVAATAERLNAERTIDLIGYVQGDDIPDEVFVPFAEVIARDHAAIYGASLAEMEALGMKAEDRLCKIVRRTRPVVQSRIPKIVGW
jgi:hypothetical protein